MRSAAEAARAVCGAIALAVVSLPGCGGDAGKPSGVDAGGDGGEDGGGDGGGDGGADGGDGGGDGGDPPCASGESWETVGAPFIYTWCTPCHGSAVPLDGRQGAPLEPRMDSHADVQAAAGRVRARALAGEGSPMPPAGGPSEAELLALEAWLDCGAP